MLPIVGKNVSALIARSHRSVPMLCGVSQSFLFNQFWKIFLFILWPNATKVFAKWMNILSPSYFSKDCSAKDGQAKVHSDQFHRNCSLRTADGDIAILSHQWQRSGHKTHRTFSDDFPPNYSLMTNLVLWEKCSKQFRRFSSWWAAASWRQIWWSCGQTHLRFLPQPSPVNL